MTSWARHRPRGVLAVLAAALATACAVPLGGGADDGIATPTARRGWSVETREHVALWYHGLSFVLPPEAALPLAIYDEEERERALRRAGERPTPVERAAEQLRTEFAGSSAYQQLQFLPLYFDDASSLFNAIQLWQQAQGNPQQAGSQAGAQAVALLSGMFETARQRRAVVDFATALQEEGRTYYGAYWSARQPTLGTLSDAAAREWSVLQDSLRPLLEYLDVVDGQVLLTPSLGPEGRTITMGRFARVAVNTPPVGSSAATAGAEVSYTLLKELMYSLVGDVIGEHVSPARVREFGEEVLQTRAAVRAGAMALERRAPNRLAQYRAYYLRMAGKGGTGDTEFRNTYALPLELVSGLGKAIDQALAGI